MIKGATLKVMFSKTETIMTVLPEQDNAEAYSMIK